MTSDRLDDARHLMDRLDRALPPHTHAIDGEHDDDPLVEAARRLAAAPPPALSPDVVDRIEARLLARLAELAPPPGHSQAASRGAGGRLLRLAVAACLIFLFMGAFGMARASADSLPGDALYPVKRAIESGQLALVSQDDEAGLRVEFAERRVDEFRRLFERGTVYPQALEEATDQIGRALRLVGTGEAGGDRLDAEIRHIIEQQAALATQAIPAAPPAAQLRLESVLDENARLWADVGPEPDPAAPDAGEPTVTVPPRASPTPTPPPATASPTPSATPTASVTPVPSATPSATHTATAQSSPTRGMTPTPRPPADLAPEPLVVPSRTPPGHGPTPGLGNSPPGQGGPHPGQGNNGAPPGQQDGSPGNSGNAPGQQSDGPPGNSGNAPGQQPDGPPGNSGNAPGQQPGGPHPGQGDNGVPPGQQDGSPGNSGNAPGQQSGGPPGNSGSAPGQQSDGPPGNSGNAPGQQNKPNTGPH